MKVNVMGIFVDIKKLAEGLIVPVVAVALLVLIPHTTSTMNIARGVDPGEWFINFRANNIDYNPDMGFALRLASNLQKTHTSGKPFRVVHIGDSHIQADFFTGEVRRLLSQYFGEQTPSRGFIFPFSIAGSNNPRDVRWGTNAKWATRKILDKASDGLTGIAGISIETRQANSYLELTLTNPDSSTAPNFDVLRLYFENDRLSFTPEPEPGDFRIDYASPVCITFRLAEPQSGIRILIMQNNPQQQRFILYGAELINSHSRVVYNAAGVNGADAESYLKSIRCLDQLAEMAPDLVLVSLGTNDAFSNAYAPERFRISLDSLTRGIQQAAPAASIIISTPGDHLLKSRQSNPKLESVRETIYSIAQDRGCGVWDFYGVMGGSGAMQRWARHGLCAPDHLHLNSKGYRLQGALLFDALVGLAQEYQPPHPD
jgi:lysophospholipase L1-like esterase